MSNVPSGQVATFPALTLEIRCVLVGLRSKTSLNECLEGRLSLEASIDYHLTKPVEFHELRTLLQEITLP